ncbi:MAG: methionyl-tRNA formyltransferase, partial [Gammaproteobacteria bacterium]|nr:methionyl-tRNA formyltransferase [Gammaproteobacteria bacterium]
LSRLGADLLSQTLCNWRHLQAQPQSTIGVMYAPKIEKHHTHIIWEGLALDMVNKTRAFNPHPGAYAYLRGDFVKIWDCEMGKDGGMAVVPGTIIAIHLTGIIVATGDNKTIVIKELQKSGGKRLLAWEFANGLRLCVGEVFH